MQNHTPSATNSGFKRRKRRYAHKPPAISTTRIASEKTVAQDTREHSDAIPEALKFINNHLALYCQYRMQSPEVLRALLAARGVPARLCIQGYCELVDLAVWTHFVAGEPTRVIELTSNWKQWHVKFIPVCDLPF